MGRGTGGGGEAGTTGCEKEGSFGLLVGVGGFGGVLGVGSFSGGTFLCSCGFSCCDLCASGDLGIFRGGKSGLCKGFSSGLLGVFGGGAELEFGGVEEVKSSRLGGGF